jgi:hypothetical protein
MSALLGDALCGASETRTEDACMVSHDTEEGLGIGPFQLSICYGDMSKFASLVR